MPKDPIRPTVGGIKPYVPGKPADEVEREFSVSGVIKMASNENPLGPSKKAIDAINRASKDVHLYPDQTSFELVNMLADKTNIPPENIAIGNGSDEIMQSAALAYISAGDEVVISLNTFSTYETVSRLMDASIVKVNLNNYTYDLNTMAKMIGPKTKMMFICNPNSPTGTIVTKKQMDDFMNKVPADTIVIIDEAYGEYVESPDYPDTLEYVRQKKNVIITRTFSKLYGLAGLRIGYAIARPEIIKYLNLVRLPFSVNKLGQLAAVAALSDHHHAETSKKLNHDGKTYLYKELDKLGLVYVKTEANFIFINLNADADSIFMKMLKKGIIIRPLTSFGLPGAIRVTIGTEEQNSRFIKALGETIRT